MKPDQVPQPKDPALLAAEMYIGEIMTRLGAFGGNDSEISNLIKIRQEMENGKLSPKDAKEIAYATIDRKQDYH